MADKLAIEIEYCTEWEYGPRAVRLTDELIDTLEPHLASIKLVPSEGGVFEVSVDGKVVHSKARTGRFPQFVELKAKIEALAG